MKKIQLSKWGRRLVCRASAVTLVSHVHKKMPNYRFHGSYAARQLLQRFKSQCKQLLSRQNNTIRYNYDAQSYSQNFDNGCLDDNPSPLVPR